MGATKRKKVAAAWHVALWNSIESRIEMHLEGTQEQDISIELADLDLHFMPRETIHTENSYKFTDHGIRGFLKGVGFEIRGAWNTVAVGTRSRLPASGSAFDDTAIAIENRRSHDIFMSLIRREPFYSPQSTECETVTSGEVPNKRPQGEPCR